MKIIDLLNKIANGEEVPKKIKFCLRTFVFVECDYICLDSNTDLGNCNGLSIHKWIYSNNLNDEVKIIEEDKKIEKIEIDNKDRIQALSTGNFVYTVNQPTKNIIYKINEIIDHINKGDE